MPGNLDSSGFQPFGNPSRCEPSCTRHSGSHENSGDRRARGSIRRARNQKMRRSSRVLAGTRAEDGRLPRNGLLSANVRRSLVFGGGTRRRYTIRSDRRLRQGTNKGVCPVAHLPAYPSGLKPMPSSISEPPTLNSVEEPSLPSERDEKRSKLEVRT